MALSHRHRLERTINGEKPDRVPVALWHHFPVDDQNPETLAQATLAFQKRFDFDLIKVMPPSSFCLKDWGVRDQWEGNPEGTRQYTKRVIEKEADWEKLSILDPTKGHLGQQLTCLELLSKSLEKETPFIQTIFNPLSQAKNLVGPDQLPVHLRQYPNAVHKGLKIIMESTLRFLSAAKKTGIAGIFFAIQHATPAILTESEYTEFGKAYDLPILKAAEDLWLNMVHIHGEPIQFDLISDYPVQILNWHDRETAPSIGDGQRICKGTVCGGISRIESFVLGTPVQITAEARDAFEQTEGKYLILGTGCVLPLTTPYGNIMAARRAAEGLS
jgi:uroporphyrinogen decarboxylase